jgi:hypothetical protein
MSARLDKKSHPKYGDTDKKDLHVPKNGTT